MSSIFEARSPS